MHPVFYKGRKMLKKEPNESMLTKIMLVVCSYCLSNSYNCSPFLKRKKKKVFLAQNQLNRYTFFYKKHLYKELEAEKGSKNKEFLRN